MEDVNIRRWSHESCLGESYVAEKPRACPAAAKQLWVGWGDPICKGRAGTWPQRQREALRLYLRVLGSWRCCWAKEWWG